ncbi:MAG: pyridoxine 5'-phosphate synthase [candidate division WOR-3 bacterium]
MAELMRQLSVNLDHIATLRQARRERFPDPVQAAVLAELGGADGITVHLRQDRRHINERDVTLLRATLRTGLNMELAATAEMAAIACRVQPYQVTLVPESPTEVTTEGGLDLARHLDRIAPLARRLRRAGIRLSAFIEAEASQVQAASRIGCVVVEINTDRYSRLFAAQTLGSPGRTRARPEVELARIAECGAQAKKLGLTVHAGHGLDYLNILPLLTIKELQGFSIGFAIVARAVFTGLKEATHEMKRIMEVHS